MNDFRFSKLPGSDDVADQISPPAQGYYTSPDTPAYESPGVTRNSYGHGQISQPPRGYHDSLSPEPAEFENSRFSRHSNASDYINHQVHTVSKFADHRTSGTPTFGTTYDPTSQYQDTEKLLKKQSRISIGGSSIFSRLTDSGVSKFAAPLFAAPWKHELKASSGGTALPSTARQFSRARQQRRILFNGLLQLMIPVAFCACIVAVLWSYDQRYILTRRDKYIFNVLVLGFSLCLGFAVASGLKRYAELMRWRFLAGGYRNIQDFDLIMGCGSQTKVLRLLWAGRTPGSWWPNGLQVVCFIYLFLMVGLQVVVACLGLTYSIDNSNQWVGQVYGMVSVADLRTIQTYDNTAALSTMDPATAFVSQAGSANAYGIAAQRFDVLVDPEPYPAYSETIYTYDNYSLYWYYFIDQAPDSSALVASPSYVSQRWVSSYATCQELDITGDRYAATSNITYTDSNGDSTWLTVGDTVTYLTTTYFSNSAQTCGPRCTDIFVYNTGYDGSDPDAPVAIPSQLFSCQNVVSTVGDIGEDLNPADVALPDEQARLLAGAIGWSGSHYDDSTLEAKNYPPTSIWSWDGDSKTADYVSAIVMWFSTGALAAMDQGGIRRNVTGLSPVAAQAVSVKWPWAATVLAVVPGIQFIALLCVCIWANGAVIKDDSYFSVARLLRPVVEKLGNRGCLLSGDEIAEVLGNFKIIYGVRVPGQMGYDHHGNEDGLMHLDIIEETEGLGKEMEEGWRAGRSMPQGRYDGILEEFDEKSHLLNDDELDQTPHQRSQKRRTTRRTRKTRRMSI